MYEHELRNWNLQSWSLAAWAQYNGALDRDGNQIMEVRGLWPEERFEDFCNRVFPGAQSCYQVGVYPRELVGDGKHFFSLSRGDFLRWITKDEPIEFYQSMLQKPDHKIVPHFGERNDEFMWHINTNVQGLNAIIHESIADYFAGDLDFQASLRRHTWEHFRSQGVDEHMCHTLESYLSQIPRRIPFLIDLESQPKSWDIVDPMHWIVSERLREMSFNHETVYSGAGVHVVGQIPGFIPRTNIVNPTFVRLAAVGGALQQKTAEKCAFTRFPSRKIAPTALLFQRAYQGKYKLQNLLFANLGPEIEKAIGLPVEASDNIVRGGIFDLSAETRQGGLGDFGNAGERYSKVHPETIFRILRSKVIDGNRYEYHHGNSRDVQARYDPEMAKYELIHNDCCMPDCSLGVDNLINWWDHSNMKAYDDEANQYMEPEFVESIYENNYHIGNFNLRCGDASRAIIDTPQPCVLNPDFLEAANTEWAAAGLPPVLRKAAVRAVLYDKHEQIDISPKYSLDEQSKYIDVIEAKHYAD